MERQHGELKRQIACPAMEPICSRQVIDVMALGGIRRGRRRPACADVPPRRQMPIVRRSSFRGFRLLSALTVSQTSSSLNLCLSTSPGCGTSNATGEVLTVDESPARHQENATHET